MKKTYNGIRYDTSKSYKIFERGGETLWVMSTERYDWHFLTSGEEIKPIEVDEARNWVKEHFPYDTTRVARARISLKSMKNM